MSMAAVGMRRAYALHEWVEVTFREYDTRGAAPSIPVVRYRRCGNGGGHSKFPFSVRARRLLIVVLVSVPPAQSRGGGGGERPGIIARV